MLSAHFERTRARINRGDARAPVIEYQRGPGNGTAGPAFVQNGKPVWLNVTNKQIATSAWWMILGPVKRVYDLFIRIYLFIIYCRCVPTLAGLIHYFHTSSMMRRRATPDVPRRTRAKSAAWTRWQVPSRKRFFTQTSSRWLITIFVGRFEHARQDTSREQRGLLANAAESIEAIDLERRRNVLRKTILIDAGKH